MWEGLNQPWLALKMDEGPHVKECEGLPEAGEGKELDSALELGC